MIFMVNFGTHVAKPTDNNKPLLILHDKQNLVRKGLRRLRVAVTGRRIASEVKKGSRVLYLLATYSKREVN